MNEKTDVMIWLSILDNEVFHLIAETSAIVIGSMLMGILLAYLYWGSYKKKVTQLNKKLDLERDLVLDLREQLRENSLIRDHQSTELSEERAKYSAQAKTIYELNQRKYQDESKANENSQLINQLNETIRLYEERLRIIENELIASRESTNVPFKQNAHQTTRANYEHVSQLLGRQVTENDLTIISGIGPRTSSLLQKLGITTWDALAKTQVETLREILNAAGGNYKSIDPIHWPKQASMAAQSEWRKLRVFQETIKKITE